MAIALSMKSLEELCLTHVAMTLEQYPTGSLSLLPKGFRVQLLHKIPIIDVCRLEDTEFVTGIDMEPVWRQFALDLESVWRQDTTGFDDLAPSAIESSWKHKFFSAFLDFIVQGKRPYGHFNYVGVGEGDQVVDVHPVDYINYLVAIKCEDSIPKENLIPSGAEYIVWPMTYREELHKSLTMHERNHNGSPLPCLRPPGKAYHEACRAKQLVPPRYTKFFSEGNSYLPDSTALELITENCYFQPKKMYVLVSALVLTVPSFLKEGKDIVWLEKLMKNVESLYVATGHNCSNAYVAIPSKIVQLIVQQEEPKLTSVTVNCFNSHSLKLKDVLDSLAPVLTSSYSGLTELNIDVKASQFPNLDSLVEITEHHSLLHTVSVKCHNRFRGELNMSMLLMKPWLKICFTKPSLRHFKLSLSPMPTHVMMDILAMFLSTPRSQEQTLTFSAMDIGSSSTQGTPSNKGKFFEDSILQFKSLEFHHCSFEPSFMFCLLSFPPLKVKKISLNIYAGTKQSLQIAGHPRVKLEALDITGARMDGSEDFDDILSKNSLKTVQFVNSPGIGCTALCEAATRHGFNVEETKKDNRCIYTLTKM